MLFSANKTARTIGGRYSSQVLPCALSLSAAIINPGIRISPANRLNAATSIGGALPANIRLNKRSNGAIAVLSLAGIFGNKVVSAEVGSKK